ncbi:hypothetical protein ES703_47507 [subsurface metagenome]
MSELLEYEVIITDKDGKVIQRVKGPARSYLKAYNQLRLGQMSNVVQTVKDTGGTNRTPTAGDTYLLGMESAEDVVTHGIRYGTGDTAVDISDYALEAPIGQGAGAGQLDHYICQAGSPTVSATESAFELKRGAVNGSGDTIIVKEIGVYAIARQAAVLYYFCIVRDVLGAPVTIPDGGGITVIYTFKAVE